MEQAATAAQSLADEGLRVVPKVLDVAKEEDMASLAADVEKEFGVLDVLVNNAGINSKDDADEGVRLRSAKLEVLDSDQILRHVQINSVSPILMVKHFRPLLKKSDKPCVVNIGSWLGSIGIKETNVANYAYATSKAALNMMNRAAAVECKDEGIIALVVNPGWVRTDMGGGQADLTPEQSVRGCIDNVLNKCTIDDSGNFFQWDGSIHPW
mmetsp:Transcript_27430/g.88579  ORF Transcript_27430/g.88579 Transcript_27430/m.88579 type:complete len:211 (+) Transcript_27430:235-867(+)